MTKNKNVRTVRVKVYTFDGLNEKAQEQAIDCMRRSYYEDGYAWDSENRKSLKKFIDIFPVELYRRGEGFRFVDRTGHQTLSELSGIRLATFIWNHYRRDLFKAKYMSNKPVGSANYRYRYSNCQITHECVLTGYWMDDQILQPVYDFLNKPVASIDFEYLMTTCYAAWEKAIETDQEFQDSREQIVENIRANEYEFTADGKRF